MTLTTPLVTVIAVCYNHSRFVVECLESIRQQTYRPIHLVIMDDASTDQSLHIIRDWISHNAIESIFIHHTENKGLCRTLNEALGFAKGKYVSMISTDDVFMPDKLCHQVAQMERLPEDVGVLYSDASQIDEDGRALPKMFIESHREFPKPPEGYIFSTLLEGNFLPAMTTLIRRSCFDRVGFYDERLCYEDWDMWLRISAHYRFVFSPIVSAKYRIVSTSLVRTVLHGQNPERFLSDFLICYKLLRSGRINEEQAKQLKRRLMAAAEAMYRLKYPRRHFHLWKALRYPAGLRTLAIAGLSQFGIPYAGFCLLSNQYGRIRRWIVAVRRK